MGRKYSLLLKRSLAFIAVVMIIGFLPAVGEIEAGSSSILICIDPGHGGRDSGAVGPTGLTEKEVMKIVSTDKLGRKRDDRFIDLERMGSIVNTRYQRISDEMKKNNPDISQEALDAAVMMKLEEEFGLGGR